MKTYSLNTIDRDGRYRGYGLIRDRLNEDDVEWLRINLPNSWFYGYDEGVVNRVLYFQYKEDRTLFLLACGP